MTELNRDDGPEQRRASRFAVSLDVSVRAKGSRQVPATLTSMSRFGCRIAGPALSRADHLVWVRIPGLESQAAELRWSDQSGAGLEFRHPLHVAVADRFRDPEAELECSCRPYSPITGFGFKLPC